ncbi:MAG: hypothetical protein ACE5FL_00755 [Myxococcota bacterium]
MAGRSSARVVAGLIALVFLLALGSRLWALDRLPGLNADEAWLSTQVIDFLSGRQSSAVTPTDNPINPFHALPLALVESVRRTPSILNLRIPMAVCGVLLMVLAFPLTRSCLGARRAICFSILVWVLPQHVGYARFGWDASQTPLVTLLCLAAALRGHTAWMAVALVASVWVHPTNVFLVPLLAGLVAGQVLSGARRLDPRDWAWIALGVAVVGVFGLARSSGSLDLARGLSTLLDPAVVFAQIVGVGRLISGATIVQYIVGPLSDSTLLCFDGVFWGAFLLLAATGLPRLIRGRDGAILGLFAGTLVSVAAVTVVAGGHPFVPGWERYAMFLTIPSCLILACLLAPPAADARDGARVVTPSPALAALALACLAWLAVFVLHYHVPLDTRGSRSYEVFSTGTAEPKAAAFQGISSDAPEGPVQILTEDYWTYWPMRYFGAREERIRVENFDPAKLRAAVSTGPASGPPTFAVGFATGGLARSLDRQLRSPGARPVVSQKTYSDAAGEPILHVWRLR